MWQILYKSRDNETDSALHVNYCSDCNFEVTDGICLWPDVFLFSWCSLVVVIYGDKQEIVKSEVILQTISLLKK